MALIWKKGLFLTYFSHFLVETWTVTKKIGKALDGWYTIVLRAALDISWKSHITNRELYGDLPKITAKITNRRLRFAGHCKRRKGSVVSNLIPGNQHSGKEQQEDLQKHMLTNCKQTLATQLGRWRAVWRTGIYGEPSLGSVRLRLSEWGWGKSYKTSFSTHLTHIHTCILLTLLTFFALPIWKKKIRIYQVWFLFGMSPGIDSYSRQFGTINK